jgi:uroporphyrinogen decarboxylase
VYQSRTAAILSRGAENARDNVSTGGRVTKREVIRRVLDGQKPPYVPWSFSFTLEAAETLSRHVGTQDLDTALHNHLLGLGSPVGFFEAVADDRVRDVFGVVWDRSVDKDIGIVEHPVLPEPTLRGYRFPDPADARFFADIPEKLARCGDRFRVFEIGFSLYERAWTMRGMENFMMDLVEHPDFVREFLGAIADYNIAQTRRALEFDIDAVYFGDDWGQQRGLQMGPVLWREFIYPELQRMYGVVRAAGKSVWIHSCGDVDELFDDLIGIGLQCFNPFQPEVMDVAALLERYRGRLAFHGGLSTQRTLPYGTPRDVRAETRRLIALGRAGGYILAPAHAIEGDVPLENMLAMIGEALNQPGFTESVTHGGSLRP